MSDYEAQLDHLFDLSPKEFVAQRDLLAKALSRGGDRQRAAEVKKLTKPTVPSWTINQLVRRERAEVDRFLAASDRLRHAQVQMMAGTVDPDFPDATRDQRAALGTLLEHAEAFLQGAGLEASRTYLDRIAKSLRAAAVDDDARPRLLAGRLTEDLEERGFDALALQLAAQPAAPSPRAAVALAAPLPSPKIAEPMASELTPAIDFSAAHVESQNTEESAAFLPQPASEPAPAEADGAVDARQRRRRALDDARRLAEERHEAELAARTVLRGAEKKSMESRHAVEEARDARDAARRTLAAAQAKLAEAEREVAETEAAARDADSMAEAARARMIAASEAAEAAERVVEVLRSSPEG